MSLFILQLCAYCDIFNSESIYLRLQERRMCMRRLLIAALALFLCLSAVGCDAKEQVEYPWQITEYDGELQPQNEKVVIEFMDNTLTREGATLNINNRTKQKFSCCPCCYSLQLYTNEAWYDIETIPFACMLGLLEAGPGGMCRNKVNWTGAYGQLPAGKYRLVKPYTLDKEEYFAAVEFEIPA